MSVTLYELSKAGQEMQRLLESVDGEITPELEAELDDLIAAGEDKLEAAAMVVKRYEVDADSSLALAIRIEDEAARVRDVATAAQARADRLKARMSHVLDAVFNGKVRTRVGLIYNQNSPDHKTFDALPERMQFIAYSYPQFARVELNRRALSDALKAGKNLPPDVKVTDVPGKRTCRIGPGKRGLQP
jgi:hypothetical protein